MDKIIESIRCKGFMNNAYIELSRYKKSVEKNYHVLNFCVGNSREFLKHIIEKNINDEELIKILNEIYESCDIGEYEKLLFFVNIEHYVIKKPKYVKMLLFSFKCISPKHIEILNKNKYIKCQDYILCDDIKNKCDNLSYIKLVSFIFDLNWRRYIGKIINFIRDPNNEAYFVDKEVQDKLGRILYDCCYVCNDKYCNNLLELLTKYECYETELCLYYLLKHRKDKCDKKLIENCTDKILKKRFVSPYLISVLIWL